MTNYTYVDGVNPSKTATTNGHWVKTTMTRLISAAGNGWSQTMTYDGFGNLIARVGAQPMNTPADPNTNRLVGYSYDANGNQLSSSAVYDAENRIVQANSGLIMYGYDAQNKRIWQGTCTLGFNCAQGVINVDTVTMFGADGRQAGTFAPQVTWTNNQTQVAITFTVVSRRAYFGGKLVGQYNPGLGANTLPAVQDRLGSVGKYYPYGEERGGNPPNDQVKFATYTRDSGTGLDYADQRYYASTFGRFMTPDPMQQAVSSKTPQNWNRYAYVANDPINSLDPNGFALIAPEEYQPDISISYIEDLVAAGGGSIDPGTLALWAVYLPIIIGVPPPDPGPPPSVPDPQVLCEAQETAYLFAYLTKYGSPLAPYAPQIVRAGDLNGIDDRFIVALAGAETTYGTRIDTKDWGPYNAWSLQTHKADNPYDNWIQAIADVVNLIATDSRYLPAGRNTTDTIYPVYQGPGYETGLKNLNSIYLDNLGGGKVAGNPKEVDFARCPF